MDPFGCNSKRQQGVAAERGAHGPRSDGGKCFIKQRPPLSRTATLDPRPNNIDRQAMLMKMAEPRREKCQRPIQALPVGDRRVAYQQAGQPRGGAFVALPIDRDVAMPGWVRLAAPGPLGKPRDITAHSGPD